MIFVMLFDKIKKAFKIAHFTKIRAKIFLCPLCGCSILIKLNDHELGIRCVRCGSSIITMSFIQVFKKIVPELNQKKVYELSSQGPLLNYLTKRTKQLVFSEFFDDVKPGALKN